MTIDKCSGCLEEIYPPYNWLEKLIGELPTSVYKNPSCIHTMHLVCARKWFSVGGENSRKCPTCREDFINIKTWKESHNATMKKVIAIAVFIFAALTINLFSNGVTFRGLVELSLGWYVTRNYLLDYAYCYYYGIGLEQIRN